MFFRLFTEDNIPGYYGNPQSDEEILRKSGLALGIGITDVTQNISG
jgi:hypothetical protein